MMRPIFHQTKAVIASWSGDLQSWIVVSRTPNLLSETAAFRTRHLTEVRPLQAPPSLATSVAAALVHVGTSAGVAAALTLAHRTGHTAVAGVLYVPAAFYIGSRFRALCNMMHEAVHHSLAPSVRANSIFGSVLSIIDMSDFAAYAREHGSHHRFLGDASRDLDFAGRQDLFDSGTGPFWRAHLLRPLTLFHWRRFFSPKVYVRGDSGTMRVARFAYLAALAVLAQYVVGWLPMLAFYVVPFAVTYQVFRYWSDAVDHARVATSKEEIDRARNHAFSSAVLNWILFPRSDEFHLVHHLYPKVPSGQHANVHRLLLGDAFYSSRRHDFGQLFETTQVAAAAEPAVEAPVSQARLISEPAAVSGEWPRAGALATTSSGERETA